MFSYSIFSEELITMERGELRHAISSQNVRLVQ